MATSTSSSELDIDTVKKRTRITDQQLDRRIEEDKLWELAGHLGNYELFIGNPGFRLNEADKADLSTCTLKNGYQHSMVEALNKWSNVTSSFTYRSLVEILVKLNIRTMAETVCEIASRPISRKRGASEMKPTEMEPSKRTPDQVRSGIDVEINKFEERFINLREATLKELEDSKVSISNFRKALIILPSKVSSANRKFVLSKLTLFEKAKSIEAIFAHLSFYLCFIDFDLLEHIIKKFGSKRLKEDMSCYARDMKQFKARTTISEALKYLPKPTLSEQANPPKGFTVFKSKFDIDINVATLEKLDECGKMYASELSLSRLAFFLFEFRESSLLVTWLVPISLEMALCKIMEQKISSFFLGNNILKLSLGEKQLYPLKKKICVSKTNPKMLVTTTKLLDDTDPLDPLQSSVTKVSQSSVKELTVDTGTAKPHHSSEYSDPGPHRVTADKISTLMESTPDCRGLAIMISWRGLVCGFEPFETYMSKFFSSFCRFALYIPQTTLHLSLSLPSLRPTMESLHLVELKHRPIMVVASGVVIRYHNIYTDHGGINIKDDVVKLLFSPATPHLADSPKIFLFITGFGSDYSSMQEIFPSSGGNYMVVFISCHDDNSAISAVLPILESPQESVQVIFKSLEHILLEQLPPGCMEVIDHLNEPVYLHPDAPQGTHSGPGPTSYVYKNLIASIPSDSDDRSDTLSVISGDTGYSSRSPIAPSLIKSVSLRAGKWLGSGPTKKLPSKQLEEVISSVKKLTIDEDLPGVEVVGCTTLMLTNSHTNFAWDDYGFRLTVPSDSLPAGVDQCQLDIIASTAGKYKLPESFPQLVSGVFWVHPSVPGRFRKQVTVEIEHCAQMTSSTELSFIKAQESLPYRFVEVKEHCSYSEKISYGSLEFNLTYLTGYAVAGQNVERCYTARAYCLDRSFSEMTFHVAISWDSSTHYKAVDKHYEDIGAEKGLCCSFLFGNRSKKISVNIPVDGGVNHKGWNIYSLATPIVRKNAVDSFKPRNEPRPPSLQLKAKALTQKRVRNFHYQLSLKGTSKPDTKLLLNPRQQEQQTTRTTRRKTTRATTETTRSIRKPAINPHIPIASPQSCPKSRQYMYQSSLNTQAVGIPQSTQSRTQKLSHPQSSIPTFPPIEATQPLPTQSVTSQINPRSVMSLQSSSLPPFQSVTSLPHPKTATPHAQSVASLTSAESGLSVADIVEQTGVSHDQLQPRCAVQHLRKVALHVQNYNKLAASFGMPPGVLTGIETDLNIGYVRKTEKVFLWWRDNTRNPTYLSFVETCLELGEGNLARRMCRLLL